MAFQTCFVLCLVYFSALFVQAHGSYGDCPGTWYGSQHTPGFSCPPSYGYQSDNTYCCDEYTSHQRCCTYEDYYNYNYAYLSTGVIVGIVIGSLVFIGVVIASIVACCVCCVKAAATPTAPHPVTMHTINVPQQPGAMTAPQPLPPNYYYPAPSQQPYGAGQPQEQFQPTQPQPTPVPVANPVYEKDSSYP